MSDMQILAVSVDSKSDLQKVSDLIAKQDGVQPDFLFLSDPGHKVIDHYGLLNPDSKGLPHPATYVIDKEGIVRWKFVEVDYRIRPTNEQVLDAVKNLQ